MLSSSCLVLPAVVKQQQEEISRNHVPSLFAVSVYSFKFSSPLEIHLRRQSRQAHVKKVTFPLRTSRRWALGCVKSLHGQRHSRNLGAFFQPIPACETVLESRLCKAPRLSGLPAVCRRGAKMKRSLALCSRQIFGAALQESAKEWSLGWVITTY